MRLFLFIMVYSILLCTVFSETWAFLSRVVWWSNVSFVAGDLGIVSSLCLTFFLTSAHTFQSLAHFVFLWFLYVGWGPGLSLFLFMCLSSCPALSSKVITFLSGKLCFWTSVPLIHLFNCLGYCGFTESVEIRKSVLSNAVLQGCFG